METVCSLWEKYCVRYGKGMFFLAKSMCSLCQSQKIIVFLVENKLCSLWQLCIPYDKRENIEKIMCSLWQTEIGI